MNKFFGTVFPNKYVASVIHSEHALIEMVSIDRCSLVEFPSVKAQKNSRSYNDATEDYVEDIKID